VASRWSHTTSDLIAESDAECIRALWTALDAGVPAYGGEVDMFSSASIDWRRVVDVAERIAGIGSAEDAFRLSADDGQLVELSERRAALDGFTRMELAAAPWSLPPFVRTSIESWNFAQFAQAASVVNALVADRDAMQAEADEVGLELGDVVRQEFETAESLAEAPVELLAVQQDSLHQVAEALRLDTGDRGLLSQLGMAGRPADAQLAAMRTSWEEGEFVLAARQAERLIDDYEGSVGRGTLRLLGPLAIAALVYAGYRRSVPQGIPDGALD